MLRHAVIGLALIAIAPLHAQALGAVNLSIRDGLVWLIADRATVPEILAEWSRTGKTAIVGAEQLAAPPLTFELRGVPELEALEVILRSTGGFVTVARTAGGSDADTNRSRFARVVIVPSAGTSTKGDPRLMPAAAPAPVAPPPITVPIFTESGARRIIGPDGLPVPDDQEDAPPPPPSFPVMPPGMSIPPGFSEPPDAQPQKGRRAPGVITPPAKPPRPSGGSTSG